MKTSLRTGHFLSLAAAARPARALRSACLQSLCFERGEASAQRAVPRIAFGLDVWVQLCWFHILLCDGGHIASLSKSIFPLSKNEGNNNRTHMVGML